jgi:transcriptional regulator GlxA family with amidase domain
MRVQILLYDGFRAMDALAVVEVLRRAAAAGGDFQVQFVRLKSATITSANGLQLHVPTALELVPRADLLVLPGGGWVAGADPGSWAEAERARIGAVAAALHAQGVRLAAIDDGVLFVASAGLLEGRRATGGFHALPELARAGAELVPDADVVDEDDILTAGGIAGGLDLSVWLVQRFGGPELANLLRRELRYENRGRVWTRPP